MADMFVTGLINTDRFRVLETGAIGALEQVQAHQGDDAQGQMAEADLLVTCAVTSVDPNAGGVGGAVLGIVSGLVGAGGDGIKKSDVTLHIRLVDVETREILTAFQADGSATDAAVLGLLGGGGTAGVLGGYSNTPIEGAVKEGNLERRRGARENNSLDVFGARYLGAPPTGKSPHRGKPFEGDPMSALFRRSVSYTAITAVMALGLVACGENPRGPPKVSPEEAEALGSAVSAVMANAFDLDLAVSDEGPLSFEQTSNCPVSGTVHTSGSGTITSTISDDTETVTAEMKAELTANQCAGRTDDGRLVTFSTPSPFETTSSGEAVVANPDSPDEQLVSANFTVAWTGTLVWDLEGGFSGECKIDMQFTTVFEDGTVDYFGSGTTCGHSVESEG